MTAHGRIAGREHQQVLDDAIREVVLPCTRALLAAKPSAPWVREHA